MISKPTDSQKKALAYVKKNSREGKRGFVLWYGGVRSGKTYGSVACMLEHASKREHTQYIIGGYTQRSVFANIAPIFREMSKDCKVVGGVQRPRIEVGTNTFNVYGGGKAGDDRAIQGLTAGGVMLDEVELLDTDFILQCEARISLKGALRVYTSNKARRYSWAKKAYYDRAQRGELDCLLLDSDISENHHIDNDYIEERMREYSGVHLANFISNEFADPFTPIYLPDTVAEPIGKKPLVLAIFSEGHVRFNMPFYRDGDKWVIGRFLDDTEGLDDDTLYMVNHTARLLAREYMDKGEVRGYAPRFNERRTEIVKAAVDEGRIALSEGCELREHIDQYHHIGMYSNVVVGVFEQVAERLEAEVWL